MTKHVSVNQRKHQRSISFYGVLLVADPQGIDNNFFQGLSSYFGGTADSPAQAKNIGQIILYTIEVLLLVSASLAVIFLMVGGYNYVMSRGSEEGTEAAKKTIQSAVLGLVVIVLAFAIVRIISAILLKGGTGGSGI